MAEPCPQWREAIGALSVGRLAGADELELRAHAAGCQACAAEIASLGAVANLLAQAEPEKAEAPGAVLPDRSLPRLEGRLDVERSRTRRHRVAAAALAVAAAGALALATLPGGGDPGREVRFDTGDPDIALTATLTEAPAGTGVEVSVRGIEEGTRCRVWLRNEDGTRQPAGSFTYRYGHELEDARLTAAVEADDVQSVEIEAGGARYVAPVS